MAQARDHSPLPWHVGRASPEFHRPQCDGRCCNVWCDGVADVVWPCAGMSAADAEMVVRAVNAHDRLVAALRAAADALAGYSDDCHFGEDEEAALAEARAVLAEIDGAGREG